MVRMGCNEWLILLLIGGTVVEMQGDEMTR